MKDAVLSSNPTCRTVLPLVRYALLCLVAKARLRNQVSASLILSLQRNAGHHPRCYSTSRSIKGVYHATEVAHTLGGYTCPDHQYVPFQGFRWQRPPLPRVALHLEHAPSPAQGCAVEVHDRAPDWLRYDVAYFVLAACARDNLRTLTNIRVSFSFYHRSKCNQLR